MPLLPPLKKLPSSMSIILLNSCSSLLGSRRWRSKPLWVGVLKPTSPAVWASNWTTRLLGTCLGCPSPGPPPVSDCLSVLDLRDPKFLGIYPVRDSLFGPKPDSVHLQTPAGCGSCIGELVSTETGGGRSPMPRRAQKGNSGISFLRGTFYCAE